jgi:hypothetical protein
MVPLTTDDRQFLKFVYRQLEDRPLDPGDPRYQPPYDHPGCEDPILLVQNDIEYADSQSINLFSGFSGSGKTTELLRLRQRLTDAGYVVLYADALKYINPAAPIEISDLLIVLAGAFSDAIEEEHQIRLKGETYWDRFHNWLSTTDVNLKEIGLKTGADIKLELRTTPSFRQKLVETLGGRIGELHKDVTSFFDDGFKALREKVGADAKVVFLFDSLEQIRGSLSDEEKVTHSVEVLFSNNLRLLEIPNLHVVYTVPPWLKFVLPGVRIHLLPCLRTWSNNAERSVFELGRNALRSLIGRRFTPDGMTRFFGPEPFSRADRMIQLSGGHFRDLLRLLHETVLRATDLPVSDDAVERAIVAVRSSFLPVSLDDARWLAEIERARSTLLQTRQPAEIGRLTRFLDTHMVLYLRSGEEWYDVHPLVREEVQNIAKSGRATPTE